MQGDSRKLKKVTMIGNDGAAPDEKSQRGRDLTHALLILVLPVLLLVGCWKADFIGYDDPLHVTENKQLDEPLLKAFEWKQDTPNYPVTVTLLTYKLDKLLFAGWMPSVLGSWAPGVRFMTLVYHALAALVLWRIMLLIGLSRGCALFVACAFAVHPLATEVVCWVSERKSAVAGLLGLLAMWIWLRWEHPGRWWRIPAACALFALALLAKPSALGFLPIFVCLELFGGARGLKNEGAMYWRPSKQWLPIAGRTVPLLAMAMGMTVITIGLMKGTFIPPPGGTKTTALLTDLEIVFRYIYSYLIPTNLSAVYMIEPVRKWSDPRILLYGAPLAAIVAGSIFLAANRRRAVFGWLWFFGRSGRVSISFPMLT